MKQNKLSALYIVLILASGAVIFFAASLSVSIFERKTEAKNRFIRLQEVGDDVTDPALWGINWPKQYDSYKLTAMATRTRFGGHGGSEALPEQKIERDPWLKRMFLGYAFSIDYRDRRGHAYMLEDQEKTERQTKPQTGSCLHCHASVMPLYRQLGNGDAVAGFNKTHMTPYKELSSTLHEMGHAYPVTCSDCHNPQSMKLRITRPGFIIGIQELAESIAPLPQIPSIERWRTNGRNEDYNPNKLATRTEMRSFVCAQCHVEYYCSSSMPLEFPWSKGLKVEDLEAHWNSTSFSDGSRFYDYRHKETGAELLKAQHPEFELWSQGIHARSGVACADCHMPYQRDGAVKVSDHWVRSPLLNINRACQVCHHLPESEIKERVDQIQERNFHLLQRAGKALMDMMDAVQAAQKAGARNTDLIPVHEFQRKAQWRLDFIAAENSMGFHAPQEASRILGEAIDFARQGEVAAVKKAQNILLR
ncbi:ammonia-forming cytochrome c nitrite reductase subunit c552 [Fibrobacterota bacterium]